jgi:hypothetical protein
LVERIVAYFVVGTHGENTLSRCLEGATMELAMCRARCVAGLGIRPRVCQVRRELLPDCVRQRRVISRESGESGPQGA